MIVLRSELSIRDFMFSYLKEWQTNLFANRRIVLCFSVVHGEKTMPSRDGTERSHDIFSNAQSHKQVDTSAAELSGELSDIYNLLSSCKMSR